MNDPTNVAKPYMTATAADGAKLCRLPLGDGHMSQWVAEAYGQRTVWFSAEDLRAQAVSDKARVGVRLIDQGGTVVAWSYRFLPQPQDDEDAQAGRFAAERDEAIGVAHRAMLSSYIGKPPPILRGDAERMVDALISHGWGPLPADEAGEWDDDWPPAGE